MLLITVVRLHRAPTLKVALLVRATLATSAMVLGVWMITSAHQISITARQTLALFARTQQEATHVNVTLAPLLLTELANATKGFMSAVELALITMSVKQAIMRVLFTKFAPTLLEVMNACANRVTVMQHVQI